MNEETEADAKLEDQPAVLAETATGSEAELGDP